MYKASIMKYIAHYSHSLILNFLLCSGSDLFNVHMRRHALEKGFSLNEYCIRPVGATGLLYIYATTSGNIQCTCVRLLVLSTVCTKCYLLLFIIGTLGEPIQIESEKDIFDLIEYPYKEPHERNV